MTIPSHNSEIKQQLSEVRRLCRLGALEPNELESFWVDTDSTRDSQSSLREQVKAKLEDGRDEESNTILVYGHGGSGKSTELIKLTTELGDEYFVVRFSAAAELDLLSLTAADLLVVLAEQVVSQAAKSALSINESALEKIYEWFAEETETSTEDREAALTASAEAGLGSSALSALVKLMASIKGDIKFSSGTSVKRVSQLRQRPGALVAQVNALLDSVRLSLPDGQLLLVIIEDLDKLDIGAARKVFIEDVNVLAGINSNLIYTIPIFTFNSPDAAILRNKFGACLSLPMIQVMEWDGVTPTKGFDTVAEIIRKRIPESHLTQDAMELLIKKTGGVLQHIFEVISTAALMKTATIPLDEDHIEYGLSRKKREFYSEITLPYGGIPGEENLKNEDLYDRLVEHAKSQLAGKPSPPKTDSINQVLLRCCALVEYNGKSWHGVHPLAIDILSELGYL